MEHFHRDKMRTRGNKPKSNPVMRSQSMRNYAYRRPDAETEEFMRFIRDFQGERQPTNIRLQKQMAPLPEIGKTMNNNPGLRDSGFLDRASDTSDYDDSHLDNDIVLENSRYVSNRRKDTHVEEVLSLARSQTRDNILSRSFPNGLNANMNGHLKLIAQGNESRRKPGNRTLCVQKNNRCARNLPPIAFDDLPDRPSAPLSVYYATTSGI